MQDSNTILPKILTR